MKKILLSIITFLCFILQLPCNNIVINAQEHEQEEVLIYKLVESSNELEFGKNIIIVDETLTYAISNSLSEKYGEFNSTSILNFNKNGHEYVSISDNVQTFALEKGLLTYSYSLYSTFGYLSHSQYNQKIDETNSWRIVEDNYVSLNNCQSFGWLYFNTANFKFESIEKANTTKALIFIQCEFDELDISSITNGFEGKIISLGEAKEITSNSSYLYTKEKYFVQGQVISIKNEEFGNLTIKDAWGNELYIYGVWGDNGSTRYDSINETIRPIIGYDVILYGVLGIHNGVTEMNSSWLIHSQEHHHLFRPKFDNNRHYEECVACKTTRNIERHNLIETYIEPTCFEDGYKFFECDCGYYYKSSVTYSKNHNDGIIKYIWNEDYTSCKAEITCDTCDFYDEYYAIVTIENIYKQCEVPGILRHTAKFSKPMLTDQIYDEEVDYLPHNYEPFTYQWNEDHTKCTLLVQCTNNYSHVQRIELEAKITSSTPNCYTGTMITHTVSCPEYNFSEVYIELLDDAKHTYVIENVEFYLSGLNIFVEQQCIICKNKTTSLISITDLMRGKYFKDALNGCAGSINPSIGLITLLGLLLLRKHK